MNFETAALEMFPELANSATITRRQVTEVVAKYKVKYPNHITNPTNNVARGVFKFNAELSVGAEYGAPAVPVVLETDAELEQRIRETYNSLYKLVGAVANNNVNSLIVAGAPGLGKSHDTNKALLDINAGEYGYVFHRGYIKATHLFRLLWENRLPGQTIVLDDVDAIFSDETALNILKAGLELKSTRMIGWGSEKEFLDSDNEVIPRYFDYQGNIIFLTNLNFSELAAGNSKNAPHLSALESRSLVLDLKIKTKREIMCKIKLTVQDGMLKSKGLTEVEETELLSFMEDNIDRMKEISLRSVEKLAALFLMDKNDWRLIAKTVMLR
jgi:hypothetical protein